MICTATYCIYPGQVYIYPEILFLAFIGGRHVEYLLPQDESPLPGTRKRPVFPRLEKKNGAAFSLLLALTTGRHTKRTPSYGALFLCRCGYSVGQLESRVIESTQWQTRSLMECVFPLPHPNPKPYQGRVDCSRYPSNSSSQFSSFWLCSSHSSLPYPCSRRPQIFILLLLS